MPTLAERLADYGTALAYGQLPPGVVNEAKRRIADSIGCALGAWDSEPATLARHVAARYSSSPGGTLWGTTHRAPPDWAAFANGILVRYLDYNDTYLSKEPAHPSDNIPALIAVAEAEGRGGRDLITAVVMAYEVQCRLCDATSLRAIGWDHVTYGCFSVALSAGRLMGLDARQLRHALGIAGVTSAALRQTRVGELSQWKGCAFANAARHGVFAATLARAGMTGPAPIFEGDKGFEKLVSGPLPVAGPFADAAPLQSADEDFMFPRTSIKCWPVEYHAQSAVEATLAIRQQIEGGGGEGGEVGGGFDAFDAVESVRVESHDAAVDIIGSEPEKWAPTSRETADHSLPYIVAAALADGEMTDRQFAPQRYADPKLLGLVRRVKVVRHAELSALYPGAVGNRVTVALRDGREVSHRVDHPRGHARNRMSDALLEAKFHRMADPLLGHPRAEAVLQRVWHLENAPSVGELMPLLLVRR